MSTDTEPKITLYVTGYCPYCRMAERLLDARSIPYKTMNAEDPEVRETLVSTTGWRTVPVILFGEKLVGGYQELATLDQSGQLAKMLEGETA